MMKKHMTIAMSILVIGSSGFAQNNISDGSIQLTAPSERSVSDSASQAGGANMMGQAQNLIMSGYMFNQARRAHASRNYGMAAMYTGMAILTLRQSQEHGQSANMSFNTAGLSNAGGNGYDPEAIRDTLNGSVPEVRAISTNIKSLQDSGLLSKDLKSITTPDGKKFDAKDFGSKNAMSQAGVPGSAIQKGLDAFAAANKKAQEIAEKLKLGALTEVAGYDEGGGSGGSSAIAGEDYNAQGVPVGGVGNGSNEREPANLAGMQKNYNGEPIGVAADSIFLMMSRRYKVKEGQEAFFSEKDLLVKK